MAAVADRPCQQQGACVELECAAFVSRCTAVCVFIVVRVDQSKSPVVCSAARELTSCNSPDRPSAKSCSVEQQIAPGGS